MALLSGTEKDVKVLRELVRDLRTKVESIVRQYDKRQGRSTQVWIVKAPTGVPAMSGDTPGEATDAVVYTFNADTLALEALTDATGANVTRTVYNLSTTEVAADTYLQCKQEGSSAKLLVDFEAC